MLRNITSNKIRTLIKLYNGNIQPGTVRDIAKQLDGSNFRTETYTYLRELVALGCLTMYNGTRRDLGIIDGMSVLGKKENPTYEADKERIAKLWQHTIYFKFSRLILEDESILGVM